MYEKVYMPVMVTLTILRFLWDDFRHLISVGTLCVLVVYRKCQGQYLEVMFQSSATLWFISEQERVATHPCKTSCVSCWAL